MTEDTTNAELLTLTPDGRAVVSRELNKLKGVVNELLNQVSKGTALERPFLQTLLGLAEFHFSDVAKGLSLTSESADVVERRVQELREANLRVQQLEAQLGGLVGAEQLKAGVKLLTQRIETWWRQKGLGLTQRVSFGEHSCEVVFSCTLFGDFHLIDSDTPVSDKERLARWHASLEEAGFVLSSKASLRDIDVIDCDQSRAALLALLKQYLPTARVWAFESRAGYNRTSDQMTLASVTLHLRDYDEIMGLPVVAEPEG